MWNPFRKKIKADVNLVGNTEAVVVAYQDPPVPSAYGGATGQAAPEWPPEGENVDRSTDRQIEELRETHIIEDLWTYRLKRTVRGILLAVTALAPLWFLTLTAPADVLGINKQLLIYAAALVGLLLWLAIMVRQGGVVLKWTGLEIGIGM